MKKKFLILVISASLSLTAAFAAKPVLLKSINPSGNANPRWFTDVEGTLFFMADDGIHGSELWRSDGTPESTVLVKDINPGSASSTPGELTNVNGVLFFRAYDANGTELWQSDGTEAGTQLVRDIFYNLYEPKQYLFSSYPTYLTDVNGTLFFTAADVNEQEPEYSKYHCTLWKSDGTEDSTVWLKDIYYNTAYGSKGYEIENLTNVNGTLFFTAMTTIGYDNLNVKALWKSDGTPEGTVMVKGIYNSYDERYGIGSLTNVNGTLFFTAYDNNGTELWKSDGTEQGTYMVKNINPYSEPRPSPECLTNVSGTLFFVADDGIHGNELWKSDGTAAGTVMVKDINSGPDPSWPYDFINVDGVLFFRVENGINGDELWKSDGTAAGTVMVKDINPGPAGSDISDMTNLAGALYFAADDGIHGSELWTSDGTPAGTFMISDIYPGSASPFPSLLTDVGGKLFFSTNDFELWMYVPADNNECPDAQPVFLGQPVSASNASASGIVLTDCSYNDTADVWFYFQPPVSGQYTINTGSEEFDTTLAVFNACGGTAIACNDDYLTTDSQIVLNMIKDKNYYIRVAGFNGQTGNFELIVTGDFCPQSLAGDINGDCVVSMEDLAILASDWMTCNLYPPQLCW